MSRNKWWIATINNIPQDLTETPDLDWNCKVVKYARWQLERAPTTNKLHIQVFIESLRSSMKVLHEQAFNEGTDLNLHLVKCDPQTVLENVLNYVSKLETRVDGFKEYGIKPVTSERSGQGLRTDLRPFQDAMKEKRSLASVLQNPDTHAAFVKYPKGIEALFKYTRTPLKDIILDKRDVEVYFYYGPPDTGKTYYAELEKPFYKKPFGNEWWDGYNGEENIIIDDFKGSIAPEFFLQITQGNSMAINVKQSMDQAEWKRVKITSNDLPSQWWNQSVYAKSPTLLQAIDKRITKVFYCYQKFTRPIEFKNIQEMTDYIATHPVVHETTIGLSDSNESFGNHDIELGDDVVSQIWDK